MSGLTHEDVLQIMRIIEETQCDALHLETEGLVLDLRRRGAGGAPTNRTTAGAADLAPSVGAAPVAPAAAPAPAAQPSSPVETTSADGKPLTPVLSPVLGTFYRSPKPGAPPFVEVGQIVSPGDTLCLVEVMKLFNTVKATARVRIAKVLAEDTTLVEFKQPLFLCEEIDAGEKGGEGAR